ncbi:MAG: class I SAM-dependent methyltransferase [Bacteroidales bacterium]
MSDYADYTYNSTNPLQRFSHRTRFKNAVTAIPTNSPKSLKILDFGCGDGMFIHQLRQSIGASAFIVGYEPFMESYSINGERIEKNWSKVLKLVDEKGEFDFVTCFEVLEHLPPQLLHNALEDIHTVVAQNGSVIVSVPIEKGFPAVVKGFLRRREGESYRRIWCYRNIWRSYLGKSVERQFAEEGYLHHVGFYFEELELQFEPFFSVESRSFSPLKAAGFQFNSQVFYTLKKR